MQKSVICLFLLFAALSIFECAAEKLQEPLVRTVRHSSEATDLTDNLRRIEDENEIMKQKLEVWVKRIARRGGQDEASIRAFLLNRTSDDTDETALIDSLKRHEDENDILKQQLEWVKKTARRLRGGRDEASLDDLLVNEENSDGTAFADVSKPSTSLLHLRGKH